MTQKKAPFQPRTAAECKKFLDGVEGRATGHTPKKVHGAITRLSAEDPRVLSAGFRVMPSRDRPHRVLRGFHEFRAFSQRLLLVMPAEPVRPPEDHDADECFRNITLVSNLIGSPDMPELSEEEIERFKVSLLALAMVMSDNTMFCSVVTAISTEVRTALDSWWKNIRMSVTGHLTLPPYIRAERLTATTVTNHRDQTAIGRFVEKLRGEFARGREELVPRIPASALGVLDEVIKLNNARREALAGMVEGFSDFLPAPVDVDLEEVIRTAYWDGVEETPPEIAKRELLGAVIASFLSRVAGDSNAVPSPGDQSSSRPQGTV